MDAAGRSFGGNGAKALLIGAGTASAAGRNAGPGRNGMIAATCWLSTAGSRSSQTGAPTAATMTSAADAAAMAAVLHVNAAGGCPTGARGTGVEDSVVNCAKSAASADSHSGCAAAG